MISLHITSNVNIRDANLSSSQFSVHICRKFFRNIVCTVYGNMILLLDAIIIKIYNINVIVNISNNLNSMYILLSNKF